MPDEISKISDREQIMMIKPTKFCCNPYRGIKAFCAPIAIIRLAVVRKPDMTADKFMNGLLRIIINRYNDV